MFSLIQLQMTLLQEIPYNIDCVFEGFGGKGNIYLSGISAAQNPSLLSDLNIQSIISVAKNGLLTHKPKDLLHYLYIPVEDHQHQIIKPYFGQTYQFIEKMHCMAGISRSATIVIAYLLKKYQYSLPTIINLLRRKRNKIKPNRGFLTQLQNYASELGIKEETFFHSHKRRKTSSLQGRKKETSKILEESSKKPAEDEKSTQLSSKTPEKSKTPKHIEEKIHDFRQKVMVMSRLRSNKIKQRQSRQLQRDSPLKQHEAKSFQFSNN